MFSLHCDHSPTYATGQSIDNCTIAGIRLMSRNAGGVTATLGTARRTVRVCVSVYMRGPVMLLAGKSNRPYLQLNV